MTLGPKQPILALTLQVVASSLPSASLFATATKSMSWILGFRSDSANDFDHFAVNAYGGLTVAMASASSSGSQRLLDLYSGRVWLCSSSGFTVPKLRSQTYGLPFTEEADACRLAPYPFHDLYLAYPLFLQRHTAETIIC